MNEKERREHLVLQELIIKIKELIDDCLKKYYPEISNADQEHGKAL